MKNFVLAFSAAVVMTMTASAVPGTMKFSYSQPGKETGHYGFGKKETYDVAIRIQDPVYTGAKVTGFRVKVPVANSDIADVSGWLSSELKLEKKINVPDIESVATELSDSILSVTFATPYTIPAEGVYVGYSFTITDITGDGYPKKPILISEGVDENGLYVHSSRSHLKWAALSGNAGGVSTMEVDLATDFGAYDAVLSIAENTYVEVGKNFAVRATVVNHGSEPLTKIGYSYTVGDYSGKGEYTFATPLEKLGDSAVVDLDVDALSQTGVNDIAMTIDTFNGQVNNDPYRTSKGVVDVMPFVPVKRPLVEEYTGLRCQYCPAGYVTMEQMSRDYGDMFVGLAYHSRSYEDGCMVTLNNSQFPGSPQGFPSGDIDRRTNADIHPVNFPYYWPEFQAEMALADVDVTLDWADEAKTQFEAVAKVRFVHDYDNANFKLAIALVADGLQNEAWGQVNAYRGATDVPDTDLWNLFVDGGSTVYGLTFNDVVAYFAEPKGIDGSVPAVIKSGEYVEYSYRIKKDDVKNIKKEDFINAGAKVHAVAILLDGKTGYSLNCNKSKGINFDGTSSVETIESAEVESVAYYDLQGRKVQNPANGIFVKVETLTDGTVRRTKTMVR